MENLIEYVIVQEQQVLRYWFMSMCPTVRCLSTSWVSLNCCSNILFFFYNSEYIINENEKTENLLLPPSAIYREKREGLDMEAEG